MKLVLVLFLAVTASSLFAEATNNADGTVTYFTESGNTRRWVTNAPLDGYNWRLKSDVQVTYHSFGGAWYTETTESYDYDLDGVRDLTQTSFAAINGVGILKKTYTRDRNGIFCTQYQDSQPRYFSTSNRDGRRQTGAMDDRTVVTVYSNGFGYVYGDGSFQLEYEADKWIQSNNKRTQEGVLSEIQKREGFDSLGTRIAKLRLEREESILYAIKASGR